LLFNALKFEQIMEKNMLFSLNFEFAYLKGK
jgi:hypothetical protein